jgi:CheY-like chemotaxis protein
LVAEDDPVNREIIQAVLEESGLTVDLAEDGVQAVDLATLGGYDLILMDIQMPRMGGLEATQRIRRSHSAASIPIIALTAGVSSGEAAKCLDAGMSDFIGKPFDPEILYSVLLKWLDHANP